MKEQFKEMYDRLDRVGELAGLPNNPRLKWIATTAIRIRFIRRGDPAEVEAFEVNRRFLDRLGRWLAFEASAGDLRRLASLLEERRPACDPRTRLLFAYNAARIRWRPFKGGKLIQQGSPPTLAKVRQHYVRLFGDVSWPNGKADDRRNYDRKNRRIIKEQFKLPLAKDPNRSRRRLGHPSARKIVPC
jgi:hypothetical protein